MSGQTPRFQLRTLDALTDVWSAGDYRFSDADRHLLDALLSYVVETHHHSGVALSWTAPDAATLTLATSGGRLPPGRTVSYQYTIVDTRGIESAPSPVMTITTPAQLDRPAMPTLSATSGTLRPGTYRYGISYTHGAATLETPVSTAASVTLAAAGGVSVALPAAPTDVNWNVYRLGPGDLNWTFMATVTASPWVDDGTITADPLHQLPTANTIYSANSVTVALPEALAAGTSARIYRTMVPGTWTRSLLVETLDATYVDTGTATMAGTPPPVAPALGSPPKVDLASETDGSLVPGLTVVPVAAMFNFPGIQQLGAYSRQWVNELDQIHLSSVTAWLGDGAVPAADDLVAQLNYRPAPDDPFIALTTVTIRVGENHGDLVDLTSEDLTLNDGSCLQVELTTVGGGATPTDRDLTVIVMMVGRHGAVDPYPWE